MNGHDDLDALLTRPVGMWPEDPFCAAVMQRIRSEPPALAPDEALRQARDVARRASGAGRATRLGVAGGLLLAVAAFAAFGGIDALARTDPNAVALGWLFAGAALGWALLASDRLSPGS